MKKLLLLFAGAALASVTHAQITISSYTSTVVGTADTVNLVSPSSVLSLSDIAHTSYMWDETSLTYSGTGVYTHIAPPASDVFTMAQYADSISYTIASGISYGSNTMMQVTTGGVIELGEHVPYQHIDLSSVTSHTGDSISIPAQDVVYSQPDTTVHFPMTMSTQWTSRSHYTTHFYTTVYFLAMDNDSTTVVANRTDHDTVEGWGQMRVKDASGLASGYMDVLQVRNKVATEDSFYLGSAPASSSTLGLFGLSQGQVTYDYIVDFYRSGEIFPLLRVWFSDSSYTSPDRAEVSNERLSPAAVHSLVLASQVGVYPNPVSNRSFNIRVPATGAAWTYELVNTIGQTATTGVIAAGQNTTAVQLHNNVASGTYLLSLSNNGEPVCVKQVVIE